MTTAKVEIRVYFGTLSGEEFVGTRKGDMKEVIRQCTKLSRGTATCRGICAPLVLRTYCTETDTKDAYKLCVQYFMSEEYKYGKGLKF